MSRSASLLSFTAAALLAVCGTLRADDQDARFLDGLRQRRLFDLAQAHCNDRLRRLPPLDSAQAELTVELIRTLTLHAVHSPSSDRPPLWSEAHASASRFLRQSPPHPRASLVRFQDSLVDLALGELARHEFEAGALAADQLAPARQALRQAASQLEALAKDVSSQIPLRRRTPPRAGELTADEMIRLDEQVRHQLARADKNRALLFERGSDDRLALLLAAVDLLLRLLSQLPPGEPPAVAVQLDLAECQRLLGRSEQAMELAAPLDRNGLPPQVRLRARAELVRVAIGKNDLTAAQRIIEEGRSIDAERSAELDLAWFELLLALAHSAADRRGATTIDGMPPADLAARYQQQAAKAAESLEELHGPYWGRRASQLLISAVPRGALASVALLSRAADGLYAQGQLDQALAAYDDAAAQAKHSGDAQAALELAYKAALVEQGRSRHREAADRLRILAKTLPTHPQAPQIHLLAIWNAAKERRPQTGDQSLHAELLGEHLSLWPSSETADQARMDLGQLCETSADRRGAIDAYARVARSSPHYPAAVAALARVWREELAALAALGQPTSEAAEQAISWFRRAVNGPENRWPERWTQADRTAALAAAELIVAFQPGRASDAEDLLRRAIAASFDAPPSWLAAAQAQLVVALAAQGGRHNEALAELRAIGAASTEQMLTVLDGLSKVARRANPRTAPQIAGVELAAVALLAADRERLTSDQQLLLARVGAEALAASGRPSEALADFERLAKSHPNNGEIREGYAQLLLASSDAGHLKQALDQWRIIASRTRPQTPAWYQAKYSVALAQFKLGDRQAAATLLRYMLQAPPGLQGTGWETRFADLLKQCQG